MTNKPRKPPVAQVPTCDHCHDRNAVFRLQDFDRWHPHYCAVCFNVCFPALSKLMAQVRAGVPLIRRGELP